MAVSFQFQGGGEGLELHGVVCVVTGKGGGSETKAYALVDGRSVFGSMPFFFKMYSKTIWGMPPALPPRTFFPFKFSHWKSGSGSRPTRKFPALWVSWAKFTA